MSLACRDAQELSFLLQAEARLHRGQSGQVQRHVQVWGESKSLQVWQAWPAPGQEVLCLPKLDPAERSGGSAIYLSGWMRSHDLVSSNQ